MKRLLLLIVMIVVGVLVYRWVRVPSKVTGATGTEPVRVTVATARQQSVPVQLDEVGRAQALISVDVHPRVDGQIIEVPIKAGQEVEKGQLLFKLDPREIDAQLAQARAAQAKDEATLQSVQHDLDRYAPMAKSGYVSQQLLQQTRDLLASAKAQGEADAAQLRQLVVQRTYFDIRAPIAGKIGPLILNLGSQVTTTTTTPLVTINQLHPIYVVFSVPQDQLALLRRAMAAGPVPVSVRGDAMAPVTDGHIAYLDNTIDPATNTLVVHARFPNDDGAIWPGQYLKVTVTPAVERNALVVPTAAVQTGQDGTFVFVCRADDTVRVVPVTVGREVGGDVVITKGLVRGERVATSGQLRLSAGAKIQVVADTSAAAASGAGPAP